jgi:hypothetical protein
MSSHYFSLLKTQLMPLISSKSFPIQLIYLFSGLHLSHGPHHEFGTKRLGLRQNDMRTHFVFRYCSYFFKDGRLWNLLLQYRTVRTHREVYRAVVCCTDFTVQYRTAIPYTDNPMNSMYIWDGFFNHEGKNVRMRKRDFNCFHQSSYR